MRITPGFILLVLAASCDGGSKPTSAPAPQRDAQATRPSQPVAMATPRCPAGAYVHAAPAFCVPLPAGFTQRTDLADDSVSFDGPDGQHFSVSWAPGAERIELEAQDRMNRTSSERHRGGVKRGVVVDRGLRWQQTTEDSAVDVFVARVVSATHVISCVTSFHVSEAPEAVLDACRRLQVEGALPLEESVLDDVPGLAFETANATQRRTANDLDRAGLQHHRAGDYAAAKTDPTYPPLAVELARAIQTRSESALSPLVDASIAVKVRRTCGSCDAAEQPSALQGKDAVLAGLAVHEQITTVTKATCDAVGCCTYDFSALPGPADAYFGDASPPRLGRACFGRGSAGAYVVTDLWLELP